MPQRPTEEENAELAKLKAKASKIFDTAKEEYENAEE
jgi:hypothetical protein